MNTIITIIIIAVAFALYKFRKKFRVGGRKTTSQTSGQKIVGAVSHVLQKSIDDFTAYLRSPKLLKSMIIEKLDKIDNLLYEETESNLVELRKSINELKNLIDVWRGAAQSHMKQAHEYKSKFIEVEDIKLKQKSIRCIERSKTFNVMIDRATENITKLETQYNNIIDDFENSKFKLSIKRADLLIKFSASNIIESVTFDGLDLLISEFDSVIETKEIAVSVTNDLNSTQMQKEVSTFSMDELNSDFESLK